MHLNDCQKLFVSNTAKGWIYRTYAFKLKQKYNHIELMYLNKSRKIINQAHAFKWQPKKYSHLCSVLMFWQYLTMIVQSRSFCRWYKPAKRQFPPGYFPPLAQKKRQIPSGSIPPEKKEQYEYGSQNICTANMYIFNIKLYIVWIKIKYCW